MKAIVKNLVYWLVINGVCAQTTTSGTGHGSDCGEKRRSPNHKAPLLSTPATNLQTGLEYDCCLPPRTYKKVRFDGTVGGRSSGAVGGRTIQVTWKLLEPELLIHDPSLNSFPGSSPGFYWWVFSQEAVATLEVTTDDSFALEKLVKLSIPLKSGVSVPIEVSFGSSKTVQTPISVKTQAATAPFPCKF